MHWNSCISCLLFLCVITLSNHQRMIVQAECFTPYNNTNVRGGFNQPSITSEDACKSTCLSNQTCLGVDWNYVEKSCWFATNATDPTKYNQTGITHWDLNTTCITGPTTIPSNSSTATSTVQTLPQTTGPPSTTAVNNMSSSTSAAPAPECFIAYNNTNVRGGFNQPLITSEDACKSTCLSNQACVGIDWNSVDHGCWLATDTTDTTKYNQTGITHWDLNRTCNAVNSNSTGSTTGSTLTGGSNSSVSTTPGPTTSGQSGTTTASNSSNNATTSVTTGSPGSTTSSNVSTTPTTNNSTASTNTGTSTTTQGSNTTQTTTPTGTGTTTPGSNTTQTTTATVPSTIPPLVGCTYNWTLTNNSHVTGAVQQTAATTESACLSACEKNSSCVGVDWNIVSSLCYVITNLTDPTRINQLGINHWDVTKFCFDENSVKCSNVWSLTSDAYSTGDRLSIPASDETACRSACFSNPNCTGVDWTGNPSMCYLDLTSAATWTGGAKAHWDLTRQTNASCPSICTYRWALYPGRGYADAVPTTAADENQCRLACIRAWPNCVGLDYTSSGSCLLVLTNTSRLIDSPGTRHWSIEYMFQCGPCTNVWLTTPGVMDRNRVLVRSLTTVSDCRTACTNQPSCTGIEFVSNLCYLSNSKVFFVNVDDGFHSDIARSTCGSGCSGSWVLFPNTRSANEVPFGTNTTELDCKNGCVYDSNCTGIDYNATSRLCYLAYPGNFTSAVGINHFERIRDLNCVPSPDATTIGPGSLSSQSSLSSTTSNFTVTASNVTLKTTTIPTTILCPLWSPPFNDTSSFNCDFRGRNTTVASCQGFCLLEPTCVSINFNDANHMTPFDCYICLSSNLTFPPLYSNEHVVTYELLTPC